MSEKKVLIEQDTLDDMIRRSSDEDYLRGLTDVELRKFYQDSIGLQNFFMMMQNVAKELCNSVYGGFGTPSLRYFNQELAADITGEGRHHCVTMERTAQTYFKDVWPTDTAWIEKLRAEFPDIMGERMPKSIVKDIVITCDTDSCSEDTMVKTDCGQMTISELFNSGKEFWTERNGTEHRKVEQSVLNWSSSKNLHFTNPLSVSRHKVTKARYKLTTESGKAIIVTGDHSLIVFRDGVKLSVKASEVLLTDKILTVHE